MAADLPTTTRQWQLKTRPQGKLIPAEHLELRTVDLFPAGTERAGKILIKIT